MSRTNASVLHLFSACLAVGLFAAACGPAPEETDLQEETALKRAESAPAPASVCPTTCGDWCPMALACTVPKGCVNPGCRCPDGNCSDPGPVCPTTCGDYCAMSQACTLPKGCENPGCRCADGNC